MINQYHHQLGQVKHDQGKAEDLVGWPGHLVETQAKFHVEGMQDQVFLNIKEEDLYERTGIQKQSFNTIYQLMAIKEKKPECLEVAEKMLLLFSWFRFLTNLFQVSIFLG